LGQEGGEEGDGWVVTKVLGSTEGQGDRRNRGVWEEGRGKEMVEVVGGMGLIDGGKERDAGRVREEAGRLGRGSRSTYFPFSLSKL
jgi:hypothetical protein